MKVFVKLILVVLMICLIAGCAGTNSISDRNIDERLSGEAVQKLLAGSKIHLVEYDGAADITLAGDGTAVAVNSDRQKDSGLWRVDAQGRFCLKFKKWGFADKTCYQVYPDKEKIYRIKAQPGGNFAFMTVEGGVVFDEPAQPVAEQPSEKDISVSRHQEEQVNHSVKASAPEVEDTHGREDVRYILTMMARDCPGCNLKDINLSTADLSGAKLSGADLSGADLRGARLRNAHLQKANLSRSKLMDADLSGADLRDADLFGADLTGAILNGANLAGAITAGAKGLAQ